MENEWEKYAKRLESDEVSIRLKESQGYRSELGKVEEALETGEPPRDIYILEPEIGEDGGVVAEGGAMWSTIWISTSHGVKEWWSSMRAGKARPTVMSETGKSWPTSTEIKASHILKSFRYPGFSCRGFKKGI
ncbi:MAG: hypothetical protein ABEJ95_06015 [Candidatus Nanohalobium sp.]